MTELRQRMDDAMVLRGFAERTRQTYLACVTALARHQALPGPASTPPPSGLPPPPHHREEARLCFTLPERAVVFSP